MYNNQWGGYGSSSSTAPSQSVSTLPPKTVVYVIEWEGTGGKCMYVAATRAGAYDYKSKLEEAARLLRITGLDVTIRDEKLGD